MATISRSEITSPGFADNLLSTIVKVSDLWSKTTDGKIYTGLELHRLATIAAENNLGDYLTNRLGTKRIKTLQDQSLESEIALDASFMEKVNNGQAKSPSEHPLQPLYDLLARREYDIVRDFLGKEPSGPWIHIGSGYPETAIGLYTQFKVPIRCVDKEPNVVHDVEPILKKFDLWGENKIMVVHADGKKILPKAEVVIISAMVPNEDKSVIIDNMRKLAYGEAGEPLLILRTPSSPAFSILYPSLFNEENISDWTLKKVGDSANNLTRSEFLKSMLFKVVEKADVRRGFDGIPIETEKQLTPIL